MPNISAQIGSTLGKLERDFSIISNNLANVSTSGYKRRCNSFSKCLSDQVEGDAKAGNESPTEMKYDFSQGSVVETARPLDFALCGKGFFVIETPNGPLYTRNGTFQLNHNGQIVDSEGRTVAGENGPISIPSEGSSEISVSGDGNIKIKDAIVGKFKLVDFKADEKELLSAGLSCFEAPKDIKPKAAEHLVVKQGFKESSNVQLAQELVDMMMVSRLYESNMKLTSTNRDASKSLLNVAMG